MQCGAILRVHVGERWRYPSWRFVGDALIPYLKELIAAVPQPVHPIDLHAFLETRAEELSSRIPLQHLASGGSPAPMVSLVSQLAF